MSLTWPWQRRKEERNLFMVRLTTWHSYSSFFYFLMKVRTHTVCDREAVIIDQSWLIRKWKKRWKVCPKECGCGSSGRSPVTSWPAQTFGWHTFHHSLGASRIPAFSWSVQRIKEKRKEKPTRIKMQESREWTFL